MRLWNSLKLKQMNLLWNQTSGLSSGKRLLYGWALCFCLPCFASSRKLPERTARVTLEKYWFVLFVWSVSGRWELSIRFCRSVVCLPGVSRLSAPPIILGEWDEEGRNVKDRTADRKVLRENRGTLIAAILTLAVVSVLHGGEIQFWTVKHFIIIVDFLLYPCYTWFTKF